MITLYKLSLQEKLLEWSIQDQESQILVLSGRADGRKTSTIINSRSFNHSNEEEIRRRVDKQINRNGYSKTIPTTRQFSPMLAKEYHKNLELPEQVIVQPKFDGVRCYLTSEGAFSRKGVVFQSIPHILLPEPGLIIDGEIYIHGKPLQEISGMARRHEPVPSLGYHAFDCYDLSSPDLPFTERLDRLFHEDYTRAESHFLSVSQIDSFFEIFLKEGYEGCMIRDPSSPYVFGRTSHLLKYKASNIEEFPVHSIERKAQGKVVACCNHPNGQFETILIGDEYEQSLLLENPPKTLIVKYAGLTNSGLPYHARSQRK